MYHPTTRLLTMLELLQARGRISGAELAERLEVEPRSVRRYVTMLQELGIPITSERGRHGGYHLRRGFKLPPLMFTEDEALALTLSLLTARHTGVAGAAPAFEGALAKLDRVLPDAIREELRSVRETLTVDVPFPGTAPAAASVLAFSTAARGRHTLRMRYASNNRETTREVDPYGLVYRSGRWYAIGWCHLRHDVRTFRLDRVSEPEVLEDSFTPPEGFDVREHLLSSLRTVWSDWTVEVLIDAPLADVQRWISPVVGTPEPAPQGVRLRIDANSLDWAAHYLVGLPWPVTVISPPELMDALGRLRERAFGVLARSQERRAQQGRRE